jgi:hypothetical protein
LGGVFGGVGTLCDPAACPPAVGACCLPGGSCQLLSQSACASAGGIYRGNGTQCTNQSCPFTTPAGRCCLPNGQCIVTTQVNCANLGGTFAGAGTLCSANVCTAGVSGACCLSAATVGTLCIVTTEAFCTSRGGVYQGDGTTCSNTTCPPPSGACCLPDGSCAVLTPQACAVQQGLYRGNNVPCSAANCPRGASGGTLRGDWNNDGAVNIADVQDYLAAFSAGLGDLNGDGHCDARDLALFKEIFSTPSFTR